MHVQAYHEAVSLELLGELWVLLCFLLSEEMALSEDCLRWARLQEVQLLVEAYHCSSLVDSRLPEVVLKQTNIS